MSIQKRIVTLVITLMLFLTSCDAMQKERERKSMHKDIAEIVQQFVYAEQLSKEGKLEEAIVIGKKSVTKTKAKFGTSNELYIRGAGQLGALMCKDNQLGEGCAYLHKSYEAAKANMPKDEITYHIKHGLISAVDLIELYWEDHADAMQV